MFVSSLFIRCLSVSLFIWCLSVSLLIRCLSVCSIQVSSFIFCWSQIPAQFLLLYCPSCILKGDCLTTSPLRLWKKLSQNLGTPKVRDWRIEKQCEQFKDEKMELQRKLNDRLIQPNTFKEGRGVGLEKGSLRSTVTRYNKISPIKAA